MKRIPTALLAVILSTAGPAGAVSTGATAEAFVSGTTVKQEKTGGAAGAQASAAQVIPSPLGDVFVSSQASSLPGTLGASAVARTNGAPGGFQGQASATWSDAFVILADGHDASATGTFDGSVRVSGELLASFAGRVYADSQVYATVDLFPGTGYNGGRTVVTGSARNLAGYDITGGRTGTEGFTLSFENVPFTFNRPISVSLSLTVSASVNAIDAGVTGRADANYGHTLVWSGLSNVRGPAGAPLAAYSALSADSGYNFAPVPEPGSWVLMVCGGLVMALRSRARLRR